MSDAAAAAVCDIAVIDSLNRDSPLLFGWSHLYGNLWSGGVTLRTTTASADDRALRGAHNGAGIAAVAFFNDASHIVAAGDARSLSLWRRDDASLDAAAVVLPNAHTDIVACVAARASLPLLTASFDGTVRWWRSLDVAATTADGGASSSVEFVGHTDAVLGVVYVSEHTFVSCSRDGTAALFDVRDAAAPRRPTHCFRPLQRCAVTAVDATAHGFVAATADGSVLAFDLRRASGEPPALLHKCANAVNRVRTLPGGERTAVAFVDDDGQLHRVVVEQQQQHELMLQHRSPLRALAVDSQANLYVGALDGSIEIVQSK
jgi:WD40 repeat protein